MKKTLLLPVCAFVAMAIQAQTKHPPPPPPKIELAKYVPPAKELKDFYKRNPDVASLYWKSENDIVVIHNDKTQVVYSMKNKQEKDAFEQKYGDVGKAPLPPPPKKIS